MTNVDSSLSISYDFTRDGLKDYVRAHIDGESYSDESFYGLFEEFSYRMGLKAAEITRMVSGFGIDFYWAINMGKIKFCPEGAFDNYTYMDTEDKEWLKVDAILAFIRDETGIDQVVDDYWTQRDSARKWETI